MKKKIKNSLSIKVFLGIAGLLIVCSLLIYGSVMVFFPKSYTLVASARITNSLEQLADTLSQTPFDEADEVLEEFCKENHAYIILGSGAVSYAFGEKHDIEENKKEVVSISQEVRFVDKAEQYLVNAVVPVSAKGELMMAFLKLLPFFILIILVFSTIGAILCSRVLVRPILEISRVSKRMAGLDMTWDCKVNRTDEIGTLAESLNVMSKNLCRTMKELETANRQLRQDMEQIEKLNKQRQDFFAASSHELKTPITILKGQVESMILGIGKYKDTKKMLPETLKEIESMEQLVKEILAISKLEMSGLSEHVGNVSISEQIENVLEQLRPLAQERKITLRQELKEAVVIRGNPLLLEKALQNILNNAIRHSPKGETVEILLSKEKLLVRNFGVTIPREDLPVLFTPFYRVEKSRNKGTGGSGLGLYIVKTILNQHGLECRIENGENCVICSVFLKN